MCCITFLCCQSISTTAQHKSTTHIAKDFTFTYFHNKSVDVYDNGISHRFVDELQVSLTHTKERVQVILLSDRSIHPHSVNQHLLEYADYDGDGKTDFRFPSFQSREIYTYYLYDSSKKKFHVNDLLSQTANIAYDNLNQTLTWVKQDTLTKEYILYEYANGKERKLSQSKMEKLFFEGKKTKNYLLPLRKTFTKVGDLSFVAKVEETNLIESPSCACNESIFYYALYKKGTDGWETYIENNAKNDPGCECQVNYFELENNQVINISPIPVSGEFKLELTSLKGIIITSASFNIQ